MRGWKERVQKLLVFCLLLHSGAVHAVDLRVEQQAERLRLDVFSEGAFLSGRRTSLSGFGFGSGARYAVYDRWQVGLRMAQALTYDGGPVALYTSFTSQLTFALLGSFVGERRAIFLDGKLVARTAPTSRPLLTLGAGFEQFLFNGTQFAVPSTGLSVHMGYQFSLFGFDWYGVVRTGGLVLNKTIVIPFIANFGPVWIF